MPLHLVWLFNYNILTPFSVLISLEHSLHRGLCRRNIRSLKIWFRLLLRDCCQIFAKCFSIIHNSLNMETHCLNIAWENVLWCLVKPKVVYLNTLNFSFPSYKYIQYHSFVCTECFKITLIEICRYLICHSVSLSYLCCFRVLKFQYLPSFPLVWQDYIKYPIVRTSAQDDRGSKEKVNGGLQWQSDEKESIELEHLLFSD